jgi:hypothetical protein
MPLHLSHAHSEPALLASLRPAGPCTGLPVTLGLTQHIHTKHPLPPQTQEELNQTAPPADLCFIPPREHSPTQAENRGINERDEAGFVPEEGTWVDMGHLFRTFHPHMTGK